MSLLFCPSHGEQHVGGSGEPDLHAEVEEREMKDAKAITMENGRPATQGVCPVCGTKMFKIGKS